MENYIQLKKEDVLKIGIKDENGNDTGEYLEFDLQDMTLPLRVQKLEEEHKKNLNYLKMQEAIIKKKENKSGKKFLSSNEEEMLKVVIEFYNREIKTLDLLLGEGGTNKILNGRKPYFSMFNDIMEALEPIVPLFEKGYKDIKNRIVDKYTDSEEKNVMEV